MADRDLLAKSLDNMTDDELLTLMRKAGGVKVEDEPEPKPVQARLSDGSVVEAPNQEELNKLLIARLNEIREPEPKKAPEPQPGPQQPAPFDYDIFAKKFVKDPREGLEYLDVAETGVPVRKAVPVLLNIVGQMAKKLQEIETQQFLDTTPEYKPTVENRRAVEQIMTERGWQPNRQSLSDAFDIARARGLVKTEERKAEEPPARPFIPPRSPHVATGPTEPTNDELLAAAQTMPIEKLEELLFSAGILKSRRS